MVLRFHCPCGAPYALADHLAGRTFKCTQCRRTLKIGTPAPAPPPPVDPALEASLEWSSEFVRPRAQEPGLRPESGRQPAVARPPDDAPLELAPDPDEEGLDHSLDPDEEGPAAPPAGPRRSSGRQRALRSSQGRRALGRSSDRLARRGASGVRRGLRSSSGAGRAARRPAREDPAAHSKQCPVCEQTIARIARECPNCGVRFPGSGGAKETLGRVVPFLGPAVLGLGVLVALVVGLKVFGGRHERPRRAGVRVARKAPPPPAKEERRLAGREAGDAEDGASASARPVPEAAAQPANHGAGVREPGSGGVAGTASRPRKTPDGASAAPTEEVALVPPGPLSAHFEVLRDGEDEAELERATEALAAAAHARPLVEEARQRSLDLRYRLRLHRVLLRSGDEAARRAAVEAALKDDQGLFLALDVLEAWRLDPEGFRDALRGIPRTRGKLGARALADALAGAPLPRGQESAAALKALHRDAPPALRAWLAPCLLLAGRAEAFEETANLLSTAEPPLADLARRALHDASAGLGPPRDADAADWQRWCGEYARARAVLVRACLPFLDGEEVDPAAVAAAKREAIEEKERVLRAVPVFLREPDSYHEEVARVLGDIIARAAGPDDEEAVVAILRSLDSRRGGLRGHEIIGGALLALDRAVVAEAVEALVRIGPAVDRWQPPLLVQPARDADVEPLATYVQGLHERLAAQGRRALACFRTRHTAERVLDASLGRAERIELGALLASPQVEAELLRRFREGDKESLRILEQIGSEKTLSELIKDFNRRPDGTIGLALQRLGTPDLLPKLRRGFDGLQSAAQAGSIFRALELIGGKQAAQLALRRLEDGDRLRGLALKTLVRLGHPKAREPALEPFRRWEERGRKDPRPGRREVQALARCGKQEDGRLLMQLIEHYGASFPATADAIWGMARLGYREVVPELYGYVHTTNRFRGIAAVSLAVLGAKELPARVEALLASASGRRDLHDMVLLAAAAYVDPPRARAAAEPFLAGAREQPEAAACLAYVCALAQDGAALEALAASPREQVRAAVARGIAWAAASSDRGFAPPACLSTLRVDRALSVRLEAAVAAGYARAEGAVRDIGLALATAPAELLDEKRGGPRLLQLLADTEGDSSPRAALWNAYADLRDDPTLRFREGLGRGRLVAAELRVRAAR